jgi:aspartate aminotransferase-like enzyme
VGLSEAAVEKIGAGKGYYFNLATEIKKQRTNTTAWTAATTLVIGLEAVLAEMEAMGMERLYDETARRGAATRTALEAIGLHNYPKAAAPSMTTIDDDDANAIRSALKSEFGVNVAGGQDHLKGKIFRINHMGLIEPYEAAWVVNAVEVVLDKLGRRSFDGTAGRVFNAVYFGLGR